MGMGGYYVAVCLVMQEGSMEESSKIEYLRLGSLLSGLWPAESRSRYVIEVGRVRAKPDVLLVKTKQQDVLILYLN